MVCLSKVGVAFKVINNVMNLEPVEEDMGLDEFANALDNFDFA